MMKLKNYNQIFRLMVIGLLIILATGCDDTPTEVEDYDPEPVLTAYICNGEEISELFLERVAPLEEYYDFSNSGIVGADIRIFEVGGSDMLEFRDDPDGPGRYIPVPGQMLIPRGSTVYRIEVVTPAPHNEFIWAETTVPGEYASVGLYLEHDDGTLEPVTDGDTLNWAMPNLHWTWSEVDAAEAYQSLILTLCDRDSLVSLDPDWEPEEDEDEEDYDLFNWDWYRGDQRECTIFWLAFGWVGPHRVELRALSKSYSDYIFSIFRVDQGLINEPISNVQGGLGIFGALTKYTVHVYMERVPE